MCSTAILLEKTSSILYWYNSHRSLVASFSQQCLLQCSHSYIPPTLILGPIAKAGLDLSASSKASTHTLTSLCTFYILLQLSKHNKNFNKQFLKAIKTDASMLMTLKDLYGVYFIFTESYLWLMTSKGINPQTFHTC